MSLCASLTLCPAPHQLPICSLCVHYSAENYSPPCPPLIRPMLGHLSEDVYPGCKYVRGNIILVLPYLSFVLNINISITKWGLEKRKQGGGKKNNEELGG